MDKKAKGRFIVAWIVSMVTAISFLFLSLAALITVSELLSQSIGASIIRTIIAVVILFWTTMSMMYLPSVVEKMIYGLPAFLNIKKDKTNPA